MTYRKPLARPSVWSVQEELNYLRAARDLCLNISFFIYLTVADPWLYHTLSLEDSWVENLTAICFLLAGVLLLAAAMAEESFFRRCLYILSGVAMLFVAGEEISWGQRILGLETPDFLIGLNAQNELNVHNISTQTFSTIYYEGALTLCIVTCAAFFCRKDNLFGIPLPSIPIMLCFIMALSYTRTADGIYILYSTFNKEKGLLILFVVFTLFSRQPKWFIVSAATLSLLLASSYLHHHSSIPPDRYFEVSEYLMAIACLFYAAKLWSLQPSDSRERRRDGRDEGGNKSFELLRFPSWLIAYSLIVAGSICIALLTHSIVRTDNAVTSQSILSGKAGELIIRSVFDVYMNEDELTYFKEECYDNHTEAPFFLHLIPVNKNDLPKSREQYGFDNLDFNFDWNGQLLDENCIVANILPNYDIAKIRTGQFVRGEGNIWEAEFSIPPTTHP